MMLALVAFECSTLGCSLWAEPGGQTGLPTSQLAACHTGASSQGPSMLRTSYSLQSFDSCGARGFSSAGSSVSLNHLEGQRAGGIGEGCLPKGRIWV